MALQVIGPWVGLPVALGALTGDDQGAKPWSWSALWRSRKGHLDVLSLFGLDAASSFDSKMMVVNLDINKVQVISNENEQSYWVKQIK